MRKLAQHDSHEFDLQTHVAIAAIKKHLLLTPINLAAIVSDMISQIKNNMLSQIRAGGAAAPKLHGPHPCARSIVTFGVAFLVPLGLAVVDVTIVGLGGDLELFERSSVTRSVGLTAVGWSTRGPSGRYRAHNAPAAESPPPPRPASCDAVFLGGIEY